MAGLKMAAAGLAMLGLAACEGERKYPENLDPLTRSAVEAALRCGGKITREWHNPIRLPDGKWMTVIAEATTPDEVRKGVRPAFGGDIYINNAPPQKGYVNMFFRDGGNEGTLDGVMDGGYREEGDEVGKVGRRIPLTPTDAHQIKTIVAGACDTAIAK